ncbi:MAG: GLUG motif-containing protein [Pseudomonadota bacterium]
MNKIFITLFFLFAGIAPYAFAQGTIEDPIIVSSCSELDQIRSNLTAYYALGNDIDCSDTSTWNAGAGWDPIGTVAAPFMGSLDGKGYEISDLFINRGAVDNIGLFGVTGAGSEVKELGVVSVSIAGDDIVGAIAGDNKGTISDSYSTGTFTSTYSEAGGLVGHNNGVIHNCYSEIAISVPSGGEGGGLAGFNFGTITHSHATGAVGGYEYLGGLVGRNHVLGSISDSYATGNVGSPNDYVGGLVGENNGTVAECYATGSVGGDDNIGGFVGKNDGGPIRDSYATGNVNATAGYVGGFVGGNDYDAPVDNCYSVGHVTGSSPVGGFAGYIWGTPITDSFYDSETSGQSDTGKGEPKTTAEMLTVATFTSAGWDFQATWGMNVSENNGYPFLLWTYTVGGTVSGLQLADSIVLQNNLGDNLTVTADGTFEFLTALADGSAYAVRVLTQPADSTQFCMVTNGTGTISGKDVNEVAVVCGYKFEAGDGSAADPFQIKNPEELHAVRDYLDAHFILTADINLDVAPYNEGEGWEPIGTYVGWDDPANVPFTGSFDGNGYSIANLVINRSDQDHIGLFGHARNAQFSDLSLQVNITGRSQVGGLVGILLSSTISGVQVTGTVQGMYTEVGGLAGYIRETDIAQSSAAVEVSAGTAHIGGLVGNVQNGSSIDDCHATGSVSSPTNYAVGGLAGTFWGSTLEDSYAIGNVSGKDSVGGLAGVHGMGAITRCYATGDVTATEGGTVNFGGLAGRAESGALITDSFAVGDVSGVDKVGGLVGYHSSINAITNSYAIGRVSGTTGDLGGLVGSNVSATITASYYNSETSGQSDTGKGEPRTTAQMRAGMAYVTAETYDAWFEAGTPWGISKDFNGGYPYLLALPRFEVAATITGNGTVSWTGEYPHGAAAELLLTPDTNWRIASVTGCGGSLSGNLYTATSLRDDCTVLVSFDKKFPWVLFMPAVLSASSEK